MTRGKLLAEIKKKIKELSKDRDSLRELLAETEDIAQSCDDAIDHLENAVNTLSQYM